MSDDHGTECVLGNVPPRMTRPGCQQCRCETLPLPPHALGCDLWKFPRCTNIGWPTPEPHSCRSLPGDHTSFLRSHS